MFMDKSSWNNSLQAYGIFNVDTFFDDLQNWHLKYKTINGAFMTQNVLLNFYNTKDKSKN